MLKNKRIGVVVPCHNEEKMITRVIETMPNLVDLIIVVDDASTDSTVRKAKKAKTKAGTTIEILRLKQNGGVGKAITEGYKKTLERSIDVVGVMAGDAQMDPGELVDLIRPIVSGEADCVKGNRLIYGQSWHMIPRVRYLGNSVLSLLTKIVSGYWHVADSQTGYIAISKEILSKIDLNNLYKSYGFPNDLLVYLNIARARLKEIPIKPIYHVGGKSGIKLLKVIPTISWLLLRRFFWRLKKKYIIEDFHPLVFFYFFSFILNIASISLFVRMIYIIIQVGKIPPMNALLFVFCAIMSTQFMFFAMWFDMDYNKDLKIK